jgi:hypothetical protein
MCGKQVIDTAADVQRPAGRKQIRKLSGGVQRLGSRAASSAITAGLIPCDVSDECGHTAFARPGRRETCCHCSSCMLGAYDPFASAAVPCQRPCGRERSLTAVHSDRFSSVEAPAGTITGVHDQKRQERCGRLKSLRSILPVISAGRGLGLTALLAGPSLAQSRWASSKHRIKHANMPPSPELVRQFGEGADGRVAHTTHFGA